MKVAIERTSVKQTIGAYEAIVDKNAYVAVTEWGNGDGWDCEINEKGVEAFFHLTHDGWQALKKVMKAHLVGE